MINSDTPDFPLIFWSIVHCLVPIYGALVLQFDLVLPLGVASKAVRPPSASTGFCAHWRLQRREGPMSADDFVGLHRRWWALFFSVFHEQTQKVAPPLILLWFMWRFPNTARCPVNNLHPIRFLNIFLNFTWWISNVAVTWLPVDSAVPDWDEPCTEAPAAMLLGGLHDLFPYPLFHPCPMVRHPCYLLRISLFFFAALLLCIFVADKIGKFL